MAEISVTRTDSGPFGSRFHVSVREGDSVTRHDVSVSASDFQALGGGYRTPEDFIHACFEFLLEREPKEQILASFDISEIGRYFPEFVAQIQRG